MHSEQSAIFSLCSSIQLTPKSHTFIVLHLQEAEKRKSERKKWVFIRPSEIYLTFIIHEIHVSISAVFICQYLLLRIFLHTRSLIHSNGIYMGDVVWLSAVKIHPHFNRTNSRVASAMSLLPFATCIFGMNDPLYNRSYTDRPTHSKPMPYFWVTLVKMYFSHWQTKHVLRRKKKEK